MVQVRHVSFKDWNPIGKPIKKKTNASANTENGALNNGNLKEKSSLRNGNSFGPAAILELTNDYVKEKSVLTNTLSASKAVGNRTSTSTLLKVGSRGEEVRALQENLTKLGYDTKGADGIFGNDTKNAVIAFQRARNLEADGIVGNSTKSEITKALQEQSSLAGSDGLLKVGSRGEEVRALQENLTKLGYDTNGTDGIFGNDTKSAVVAFQRVHGLSPDGLVGSITKSKINEALKNPTPVIQTSVYTPITNGKQMNVPDPGTKIDVSLGTDKPSINATVTNTNCWTIEYSIDGCRKAYPNASCTKRLNSALEKFSYNSGKADLLQLEVPGLGKCYAGAMVEGFGNIGDVSEITLDDGTKFNFMLLDVKSTKHKSSELSPDNQCQNAWGHGYMSDNNSKVQLSICEFITSQTPKGVSSAKNCPSASGTFLDSRYVKSAKIIGHANIE